MLAARRERVLALLTARSAHLSSLEEEDRLAAEDETRVAAELTALLLSPPEPSAPAGLAAQGIPSLAAP